MLHDKSIICFGGEDWWYHHPHSKNHLMRRFARAGNKVIFVNSISMGLAPMKSGEVLPRIKQRIKKLRPGPAGPMPLLIAGGGEQVMLRLVAEHAQMWNSIASTGEFARKSALLDDYCRRIGRDPAEIERTANVGGLTPKVIDEWLKAGLQHFVLRMAHPFETKDVERLLKVRDS